MIMRVGYYKEIPGLSCEKQREELQSKDCGLIVGNGIASLLRAVEAGDFVVVCSLAVFGSTPATAVKAALEIKAKATELVVLDQGIDTSREEHRLFFQHAAAVAGIGAESAKPKRRGGKPKADPSAIANAVGMYQSGEYKISEITAATGISRATLYRNIPEANAEDG